MTPDTLTPETLRGWAYADAFAPATILAHADTWGAQVDRLANGLAFLAEDNLALRKRLEAADGVIAYYSTINGEYCVPARNYLAALAGEKP